MFSRESWTSCEYKIKLLQQFTLAHTRLTALSTDASTSPLSFFTGRMPFLPPYQQRQSTEALLHQCNFPSPRTRCAYISDRWMCVSMIWSIFNDFTWWSAHVVCVWSVGCMSLMTRCAGWGKAWPKFYRCQCCHSSPATNWKWWYDPATVTGSLVLYKSWKYWEYAGIWKLSGSTGTRTHTRLTALFFRDYPGKPVPERLNQSGFYWSKRQWVAVASAGLYASLHLAPDR